MQWLSWVVYSKFYLQGDTLMDVDSPVREEKIPQSRYTEILDFGKELLVLQRMIPESVIRPFILVLLFLYYN